MEPRFGRVLTAMVTPFNASGDVDYEEAGRMAVWLTEHGSDGLVVTGTTGESATLNREEKLRLYKTVRDAVGPEHKVLAGTGSYDTSETVVLSLEAEETGVDGLLVVTPYYNRPSQEGLFQHYKAVAEATELPIVLYNVPARTGVNLEAATTLRLAQVDGIVAVKEASGLMAQVGEITLHAPDGFELYGGADEVNLPILALGGVGNISVISHVVGPDLQEMHRAFFGGDMDTARRLHLGTLPMTKAMFSAPSPVPTKTALQMLDVLPCSRVRLPLVDASEKERALIHAALKEYGLLEGSFQRKRIMTTQANTPKTKQTNKPPKTASTRAASAGTANTKTLQIIPLGGIGEIGKNMTAIRCGDEIIVIDCGLAFPGADQLGVDLVIPDISYLLENKEMVKGIILTHGHEDHIGSLSFVLKQLNVPVYGTRLTIGFTKGKLSEYRVLDKAKLITFSADDRFKVGMFDIEPFRVSHSIPDAVGFAVHTPAGTLVHTGDFKFDQTPVDGQLFDIARLTRIGQEGVLVLLSDCTNVERPGFVPSERIVGDAFDKIFRDAQKRIILACFASNVHRVQQAIDVSVKYGRKVALMGRSMERNMEMSQQMGYLKVPEGTLIRADEIEDYFPQQVTVITTGSQGEPMAGLSRIAQDEHRKVKIVAGDSVILSASAIPGNEDAVYRTINHLFRRGANVYYDTVSTVHVSGHGYADELRLMLNLVEPQYVMPVHGEYRMLHRYAKMAEEMGWPPEDIIRAEIGDIIEVGEDVAGVIGRVEKSGAVLIDGTGIGDVSEVVLRDRLHIGSDGFLVLVVGISQETGEIVSGPEVISRGFVYMDQSEELVEEIKQVIVNKIKNLPEEDNDWMIVQQDLRDAVSKFLYKKTARRPLILPILLDL